MSELKRLNSLFKSTFEGEAWHGPAVMQVLKGVTAAQAAARPIAKAHSIWELILHMIAWQEVVRRAVARVAKFDQLAEDENFPLVEETGEESWQATLLFLQASAEELRAALRQVPDSQLDEKVEGREFTYYFMLHGLIDHNLYHAGQIALLKKAQGV